MPIDVASYLKFTPTDSTSSFAEDASGSLYYDLSEAALKHYDGNNWGRVDRDLIYGVTPGFGPYTNDSHTKLLIHSDTSNGSSTFTDSSTSAHTLTAEGGIVHSTAIYKASLGGSSIYFDGDNNYLSTTVASADKPGTGDFTWDVWVMLKYVASTTTYFMTTECGSYQHGFFDRWYNNNAVSAAHTVPNSRNIMINYHADHAMGSEINYTWHPAYNEWYHLAMVRSGSTITSYINGVAVGSDDYAGDLGAGMSSDWYIGAATHNAEQFWCGYMTEIRWSTTARWPAGENFTVYHTNHQ